MDVIKANEIYLRVSNDLDKIILDGETPAKTVTQCRRFKKALANYVAQMSKQLDLVDEIERKENEN